MIFSLNADVPAAPPSVKKQCIQGIIDLVVEWGQPAKNAGEGSILHYVIKYHPVMSPNSVISVSIAPENTTYKFVNLMPNTTYSMEIAAISCVGEGLWSTLKFTTNPACKL